MIQIEKLSSAYEKSLHRTARRTSLPRLRKIDSHIGRRSRALKILRGFLECKRSGNALIWGLLLRCFIEL